MTAETVWVDDALPGGATVVGDAGGWPWDGGNSASGITYFRSVALAGLHQQYFYNATETVTIGTGDVLYAYVYLDPANPPQEVMLQWNDGAGGWEHRAYWGQDALAWGVNGTNSRRYMGPLPATGGWVRLEVPASLVGLQGSTLNGMAFTLFGGRAWWDRAGVRHNSWRATKYYRFNGQTVAMRKNGVLSYLHGDHLGSTFATTNSSGNFSGQEWYHAYGRYRGGHELGTENRFTGQKLDGAGLMYFNARYYDPELGQFLSPDTLVPDPGNLFDYNRYMYVRGNPMNAIDPSGHICVPVVNIGNTCQGSTDWDAVQSSLDVAGVADPTPISDGVNAVISVARGNYVDAGLSAVAMVPYIGDVAKGGKYLDEAAAGARWVGDKADEGWQAAKRWTDCLINSFSAKTLVMTPSGLKAISELVEGELVLAYNETTGEIGAYPITDVISHVDPEIVLLSIDGETLETTAEHPFYELESAPWLAVGQTAGRWTDALELKVGDRVWKADGTSGVVQSVAVVPVQQRMYNLTVAEAHTFFVGNGQWLVHNQCGVKFEMRQVQSKFDDHAEAFGVTGNWNPANGAKFQQALEAHVTGKNTVAIQGVYNRGASKMNVTHYYDPTTQLNVMADQNGNFISGWKLNADQITHLLTTGILGGGK